MTEHGWLDSGERLRKLWREATQKGIERRYGSLEFLRKIPDPPAGTLCPDCGEEHHFLWTAAPYKKGLSPEFIEALEASTETDMTPLADYISSDKPLSKEEREVLSRKLPKRKPGRPKNSQLRGAA